MSQSPVEYVTVVCRVCGTRVDERLADEAREVPCPDCLEPVRIPARRELPPKPVPPPAPERPVYKLQRPEEEQHSAPPSSRSRRLGDVLVVCPVCGARLHPPLQPRSYQVRCPDCFRPVTVPSPDEAAERESRLRPPPRKEEPIETIPIPQPPSRPRPPTYLARQLAVVRREPRQRPPPATWWSGVWTFPWQSEVQGKWLVLSLCLTVLFLLVAGFIELALASQNRATLPMFLCAFPAVLVAFWTGSYAASTALTVIVETAAGNRRIVAWPEQPFRDGIGGLLALVYLWGLSLLAGHGVGWLSVRLGGSYWIWAVAAGGGLFPIALLSMLEAGAWYAAVSGPILRSLVRNVFDWAVCYLLLGALLGSLGYVWGLAMLLAPVPTAICSSPVWSAALLISARLLGRLAWRIERTSRHEAKRSTEGGSDAADAAEDS